jgi:DnaJ family protein C protein 3
MAMFVSLQLLLLQLLCFVPSGTPVVEAVKLPAAAEGASASKLRSLGENAMVAGKYDEAAQLYKKVIQMEPQNARNYYKLFRVHLRQQKYKNAVKDLASSVEVDPSYTVGYIQLGKLQMKLGRCDEAVFSLKKALELDSSNEKATGALPNAQKCARALQDAKQGMLRRDYAGAERKFAVALDVASSSADLYLQKAECNMHMRRYFEALADAGKSLKIEKEMIPALLLRAQAYYFLLEFDMAMRHLREGLKYDPEHDGCKNLWRRLKKLTKITKKADEALSAKKYEDAAAMYAMGLEVDPSNAEATKSLSIKLCNAKRGLKQYNEAEKACNRALEVDSDDVEANLAQAEVHMGQEKFDQAIRLFQKVQQHDQKNKKAQQGLQRAQAAKKQASQKNYYKILGIGRDATTREIKKAYRGLALINHPDKFPQCAGQTIEDMTEECKSVSKKWLDISEAGEVLGDEEMKAKYDRGEEVFENQGGQQQRGPRRGFNPFGGGFPGGAKFHFRF